MSYREKNFKGLLFFNILHFNIGLIILAFITMVISTVVFAHNNIRKSEEISMKNMSQNILSKKDEMESMAKYITIGIKNKSFEECNDYLYQVVNDKHSMNKIGIIGTNSEIICEGIMENHNSLRWEIDNYGWAINEVINEGKKKFVKLNNESKDIMVIIPVKENLVFMVVDNNYFDIVEGKNFESIITNGDRSEIYSSNRDELSEEEKKKIDESIDGNKRFIYKNKASGKFYSGYIDTVEGEDLNIIIEHNLLNEFKLNQVLIFSVAIIIIGLISAVLLSFKIYNIIKDHLNLITKMHEEVGRGNYNFSIPAKYESKEWRAIFDNIIKMSKKVEERESQLSMYNKELMMAHDSIGSMYKKIKSEEIKKRNQFFKVISSMLNLIELKDEYTAGHSIAVTKYSGIIAKEMNDKYGYDIDQDRLKIGAILHDIGKIGIDEKVLNKPSKLDLKEIEIIKNHPNNGSEALMEINKFDIERDIIKYHHEKYDGTGYPCGLKGEEIPLEARIVSVADAFDAMTSDRPYRKAMSIESALEELINSKGRQFDPKIVDITVILIERKKIELHDYKSIEI